MKSIITTLITIATLTTNASAGAGTASFMSGDSHSHALAFIIIGVVLAIKVVSSLSGSVEDL